MRAHKKEKLNSLNDNETKNIFGRITVRWLEDDIPNFMLKTTPPLLDFDFCYEMRNELSQRRNWIAKA